MIVRIQHSLQRLRSQQLTQFLLILIRRWGDDECLVKAAAMAFFGLISIFPIILAGVSILATVMAGNKEVLEAFGGLVAQFFPGMAGNNVEYAVKMAVYRIASGPNATSLGIVAFVSLLWSGRAYFATLVIVLNRIWPEAKDRGFLQRQILPWGMFATAGILGLLSMLTTLVLSAARPILSAFPLWFVNWFMLLNIISHVLSWGFAFLMFWLLYWFLPNVQARQRGLIFVTAILTTLAWEIAKFLYGAAAGKVLRYEAVYGSVAGVVVTLVWIYVASVILLIGAESAAAWDEMRQNAQGKNLKHVVRSRNRIVRRKA
jgi:membrane protein